MNWLALELLARAGGGGSGGGGGGGGFSGGSGGGSGGGGGWAGLIINLVIWGFIGILVLWSAYVAKKARAKKLAAIRAKADRAAASDPTWQSAEIQKRVEAVFASYQADWSNLNPEPMASYLTKPYYEHVRLMLTAMRNIDRRNTMQNVQLHSATLLQIDDQADNDLDRFEVEIVASAHDSLVDTKTNKTLYTDDSTFTEYWQFDREDGVWKLDYIRQATEAATSLVVSLRQFAADHGWYYSPDWGWLLLPQRGQLFGAANFVNSDVNNHVIGLHGTILVEFYTYVPIKTGNSSQYTIAQVTLPKTYGNIIVRRKKGLFSSKPKGLQQIEMESWDFNKKYQVFATDVEQVTSFELLHPAFILKLQELHFVVNIEVVDNIVYLYTLDRQASYPQMLAILEEAFDELKL